MTSPLPTAAAVTRRCLVLVFALVLTASTIALLSPARAAAATSTVDGITYSVTPNAGATVTNYDGSAGTAVTIPETVAINGAEYTVTAIGEQAFYTNALTSVTLPDTLTAIGDSAFQSNQLASVDLPDTVTTIGNVAFGANLLTAVTLPDNLTTIGFQAFAYNQLRSVTLPDTLTTLGDLAFQSNDLATVALPDSLTSIGFGAFQDNQLTSVTMPHALTTLDGDAFAQNGALSRVRFTGPAPAMFTGADQDYPSLGDAQGLTVEFSSQYSAQDGRAGFTTPEWRGYTTIPAYTVSFLAGADSTIDPVIMWPGETPELPTPLLQGYTFVGWYSDINSNIRFDPEAPLTGDVTVVAGWKPNSIPATPLTPASGSLSGGSIGDHSLVGYGS
ncbi:leucine-rich repeat protein [Dietzia sp. PP-33]|uniref:leucine-rich repeat protein n=1 Tax=Dietzia sp. PP-33 TaxID=2957500 RepID=UPI0029BC9220|nr:leucine-rich repeat protein [Dietzia sp. PP-33]MDX2358783.1 leucine-rich repeat protein [Dietzia sp. PP-33]